MLPLDAAVIKLVVAEACTAFEHHVRIFEELASTQG